MKFLLSSVVITSSVVTRAFAHAPRNEKEAICCHALSAHSGLERNVYYPNSSTYVERIDSFWSKSAALEPWCIALPTTTEDTSAVIQLLVANDCPFGIRSGGHSVFPYSSSVLEGITVDFGKMNATTYNPENGIASIQPGGNWGTVYDTLAQHGVVTPGARGSGVGIAGFILGGGYSFFTSAYGWVCDSVENFEVVLYDGRIVNANARENRDLWISLKGGSGNFGLVTRFDMRTFQYSDPRNPVIWGGAVFWDVNATEALIDVIVDFGNNAADDVDSTSFCMWSWDPVDPPGLACSLNNIRDVPSAPAFDGYMAVEGIISDTLRSDSMLNLTKEQYGGGGFHNIWMTGAAKNDARVLRFALKKHDELVQRLNETIPDDPARISVLQFHPITVPMVSRANGTNSLGLEDEISHGPGIMTLLLLQMTTVEAYRAVYPIAIEFQAALDDYIDAIGASWQWRYLDYADFSLDPIARYGESSVERMDGVSMKYDPDGVFQNLRKSGHKLP